MLLLTMTLPANQYDVGPAQCERLLISTQQGITQDKKTETLLRDPTGKENNRYSTT
jgi:hypothetical protein